MRSVRGHSAMFFGCPTWCCVALGVIVSLPQTLPMAADQNVIMLMLDGFANRFLDKGDLAGFKTMEKYGTRAEYMIPVYPAISLPNWYSIATGLYSESHGFTGNSMYDVETNRTFGMGLRATDYDPHWWTQTEPIWVTAQHHGRAVSCYYWAGCQVPFGDKAPAENVVTYHGRAAPTLNLSLHVDGIVDRLKTGKSRLIMAYYEDVDHIGHYFGPDSHRNKQAQAKISRTVQLLQDKIQEADLWKSTNLLVFSDHGMAQVPPRSHYYFEDCLSETQMSLIDRTVERYSIKQVFVTEKSDQKQIYDALKSCSKWPADVQVVWKWDLPDKYNFKNARFLPDILITTTEPSSNIFSKNYDDHISDTMALGMHGYDNEHPDMRAIFLARGPCFQGSRRAGYLRSVDIYEMVTRLLDVPARANNGSWSRIAEYFSDECPELDDLESNTLHWYTLPAFSISLCVIVIAVKLKYQSTQTAAQKRD